MRRSGSIGWAGMAATVALLGSACGSDPQSTPPATLTIEKAPSKSGDNQTQVAGLALSSPLRVQLTRNEIPEQGVTVHWVAGAGSFSEPTSVTGSDGIAASGAWTLGENVGDQTAQATVQGAEGSPVSFIAHAIFQPGGGGGGEAVEVSVQGPPINRFQPSTVTIEVGQTVTWRWATGATGHNVTPDEGNIPEGETGLFSAPHTYSYTFTAAGTYTYHCAAHGAAMSGTVVVEPAS
jgi:plastocyanin